MKKISSENRIDTRGSESATAEDLHLLIEITDQCNSRCIMCKQSTSKTMHRDFPKQHMETSLFIKIIEDMKDSNFNVASVDPMWNGESAIHPDFKEMMYYLFLINKNYSLFRGFVFNTNAITMDEEVSEIFLDYARFIKKMGKNYFMRIYFSLDAARPGTYQKIKNIPGENLEKVIKNIKYLIRRRKELKLDIPNLIFSFIVMPENKEDASEFRDFWQNVLKDSGVLYETVPSWPLLVDRDSVYYRRLISNDSDEAEKLHRNTCLKLGLIEKYKIAKKEKNPKPKSSFRPPCGALWRTPNIASNGNVVPCCRDTEFIMNLGNIKNQSLSDIWYGEKITQYRIAHIKGDFNVPPDVSPEVFRTCLNCLEPEGGTLSDKEIHAYLKSINKTEIMEMYLDRKVSAL